MAVTQRKGSGAAKKSQKTAKSKKKLAQPAPAKTLKKPKPAQAATPAPAPKPKRKHTGGSPKFEPEQTQRDLVALAVGVGMRQLQICELIINPHTGQKISDSTLKTHFAEEIANGAARLEAKLAANLVTRASGTGKEAVTALIFLLKSRFRWREPEPEWAEKKRLEASASAKTIIGDQEIEVTLTLEEPREAPIYAPDEKLPGEPE
jgi:hypothetical protein